MIAIALSGGIDSAAAAWLLRREGHELFGVYMRHPYQADESDLNDARRLADFLNIELHVVDVADGFAGIVDYFCDEYLRARTPNPCAVCNRRIKFGQLMDAASRSGARRFATGHYARILPHGEDRAIYRAIDATKDQSYVLFGIERSRLSRIDFPLGEKTKAEIRELVAHEGLPIPPKRESQDVCFVADGGHAAFVREYCVRNNRPALETAGNFVSPEGKILGRHPGFERFTVGQRKGFGIGFGERIFVLRIDSERRNVVLGARKELARDEIFATNMNWQCAPLEAVFRASVKVRYRTPAKDATIEILNENNVRIHFDEPIEAVAPGQCAVLYDHDRLIGGGYIP